MGDGSAVPDLIFGEDVVDALVAAAAGAANGSITAAARDEAFATSSRRSKI
jgi:hypothetical protein